MSLAAAFVSVVRTENLVRPRMDTLRSFYAGSSDMHRAANPAGVSKYAQITVNFSRTTRCFFRIVREFYGRPAVDRRDLADDRDWIESTEPSGAHPTKSLVRLVPQPKLIRTRPEK